MANSLAADRCLSVSADKTAHDGVVLAVGDVPAWTGAGRRVPTDRHVFYAEFHQVTAELLTQVAPTLVLSPLLARRFDCVDLAQVLWTLRYRGRYRAMDKRLPDPALIAREVRMLVPGLDFDVIELG